MNVRQLRYLISENVRTFNISQYTDLHVYLMMEGITTRAVIDNVSLNQRHLSQVHSLQEIPDTDPVASMEYGSI